MEERMDFHSLLIRLLQVVDYLYVSFISFLIFFFFFLPIVQHKSIKKAKTRPPPPEPPLVINNTTDRSVHVDSSTITAEEDGKPKATKMSSRLAILSKAKKDSEQKKTSEVVSDESSKSAESSTTTNISDFALKAEVLYLRSKVENLEAKLKIKEEEEVQLAKNNDGVLGANGLIQENKVSQMLDKMKEVVELVRRPLTFSEDGLDFQNSLESSEEGVIEWMKYMSLLIEAVNTYCKSSVIMEKASITLAALLSRTACASTSKKNFLYKAAEISPAISLLSDLLNNIEHSRGELVSKLENDVLPSLKTILIECTSTLEESRKLYTESKNKLLGVNGATSETVVKYEVDRFKYVQVLNSVEVSKLKVVQKLAVAGKAFVRFLSENGQYADQLYSVPSTVEEGVYQALHGHSIEAKKQEMVMENFQKEKILKYLYTSDGSDGKLGLVEFQYSGNNCDLSIILTSLPII